MALLFCKSNRNHLETLIPSPLFVSLLDHKNLAPFVSKAGLAKISPKKIMN